ncbi:baseplate J/gp47 family protein [Stomatohabitans albus]|uniref:baseplate J/gp47 family protein n=1 Tax=Stomatohabitans albus TaxID=3110766 RepID=UPI00300C7C8F
MTSGYTSVFEGQTDAQKLATRMLVDFYDRTGIPAREGNVETALIEVAAAQHADTRRIVNDMADQAMMAMAGFLGITRKPATPAAADLHLTGERGMIVPAGSQFATEDDTVWETISDTVLTDGTATARVVAVATGPVGERGRGDAVQLGPMAKLQAARVTRIVTDGTDEESVGEYLDRAAKETQIMSIVPRLPAEFAQAAMRHPQIAQAHAINLLDGQGRTGKAGHITVFVGNSQGTEIDSSVINEVTRLLNADNARPLGVQVHVAQPVRTSFTVTVQLWATAGFQDSVEEEATRRLQTYFSPAGWDWTVNRVNHYDVAAKLDGIPGVTYIQHVFFNGTDDAITLATDARPAIPVASVDVRVGG